MKLALGTAQFGSRYGIANRSGQVAPEQVKAILRYASIQGIDLVDTAIAYGNSEDSLGEAGTEAFRVVTKLPAMDPSVVDAGRWVLEQMEQSLQRLRLSQVYGLLLHRSDMLTRIHGTVIAQTLQALKKQGLVQKVGVSIYSPAELDSVLSVCQVDLVQAPFNVIDRRLHSSGWLDRLHSAGIEVHVRSAFLQGLLLLQPDALPTHFAQWKDNFMVWHDWLRQHAISPIQACLGFVGSFPGIDRIVVGVDSLLQLQQLVDAYRAPTAAVWPFVATTDESLINPSSWKLP